MTRSTYPWRRRSIQAYADHRWHRHHQLWSPSYWHYRMIEAIDRASFRRAWNGNGRPIRCCLPRDLALPHNRLGYRHSGFLAPNWMTPFWGGTNWKKYYFNSFVDEKIVQQNNKIEIGFEETNEMLPGKPFTEPTLVFATWIFYHFCMASSSSTAHLMPFQWIIALFESPLTKSFTHCDCCHTTVTTDGLYLELYNMVDAFCYLTSTTRQKLGNYDRQFAWSQFDIGLWIIWPYSSNNTDIPRSTDTDKHNNIRFQPTMNWPEVAQKSILEQ